MGRNGVEGAGGGLRQRSGWKQYAAFVGNEALERRPQDQYPQAKAALELWALDNFKDGFSRYQSPCGRYQAHGTVVARGADEYNEVSEKVDRILTDIPIEALEVVRAHFLGIFIANDHVIRIPRSYWPAKIAKRYFSADVDWYNDMLIQVLAKVAYEMGLDGL